MEQKSLEKNKFHFEKGWNFHINEQGGIFIWDMKLRVKE